MKTLVHPLTGLEITVPKARERDWLKAGWVKPSNGTADPRADTNDSLVEAPKNTTREEAS